MHVYLCVIQFIIRPYLTTALNENGTNSSHDGLFARTHILANVSCVCSTLSRGKISSTGSYGNICFLRRTSPVVFKRSETYTRYTIPAGSSNRGVILASTLCAISFESCETYFGMLVCHAIMNHPTAGLLVGFVLFVLERKLTTFREL